MLAGIGSVIEKQMKIAIMMNSFSQAIEYASVQASINTLHETNGTWNYVSIVLIEEQKRTFGHGNIFPFTETENSEATLVASEHRVITPHRNLDRSKSSKMRCFIYGRIGHMKIDCHIYNNDGNILDSDIVGKYAGSWTQMGQIVSAQAVDSETKRKHKKLKG